MLVLFCALNCHIKSGPTLRSSRLFQSELFWSLVLVSLFGLLDMNLHVIAAANCNAFVAESEWLEIHWPCLHYLENAFVISIYLFSRCCKFEITRLSFTPNSICILSVGFCTLALIVSVSGYQRTCKLRRQFASQHFSVVHLSAGHMSCIWTEGRISFCVTTDVWDAPPLLRVHSPISEIELQKLQLARNVYARLSFPYRMLGVYVLLFCLVDVFLLWPHFWWTPWYSAQLGFRVWVLDKQTNSPIVNEDSNQCTPASWEIIQLSGFLKAHGWLSGKQFHEMVALQSFTRLNHCFLFSGTPLKVVYDVLGCTFRQQALQICTSKFVPSSAI